MEEVSEEKDKLITRVRNAVVHTLVEGDILVRDDVYYHVAEGEVTIYADKTINLLHGGIMEIAPDYIPLAIATNVTIVNVDEL